MCSLCSSLVRVADDASCLLCGRCVVILASASRDDKAALVERLRSKGREAAAQAIEKFSGLGRAAGGRRVAVLPGERVREYRKARGLTQDELAKRWGTTQQYLAQIETGKRPVPARLLTKIQPGG
jgi:DNA-binding XRE family transcriptional regulator